MGFELFQDALYLPHGNSFFTKSLPTVSVKLFSEPGFCIYADVVHRWNKNQSQEGGKTKPVDDCPGKWPPEIGIVSTEIEVGFKTGKQTIKVDIQPDSQRN